MESEINYTQILVRQYQPQLMPVINAETATNFDDTQPRTSVRHVSIAIHPICDCSNCCCFFCCGCPKLYTPLEMLVNKNKLTMCPLTSKVVNPVLAADNQNISRSSTTELNPVVCVLSPITLIIDLVTFVPRLFISPCMQ